MEVNGKASSLHAPRKVSLQTEMRSRISNAPRKASVQTEMRSNISDAPRKSSLKPTPRSSISDEPHKSSLKVTPRPSISDEPRKSSLKTETRSSISDEPSKASVQADMRSSISDAPPRRPSKRKLAGWQKQLLRSGMHGLAQILHTHHMVPKLFWLFVLCLMISGTLYHVVITLIKAFAQETVTQTDYRPITTRPYPPMTICAENGYLLDGQKLRKDNVSLEQASTILFAAPFFGNALVPGEQGITNTSISSGYWTAQTIHHGTHGPALYQRFFDNYSYPCNAFFHACSNMDHAPLNCCAIFRPVFSLFYGKCFALNQNTTPSIFAPGEYSMLHIEVKQTALTLMSELRTIDGFNGVRHTQPPTKHANVVVMIGSHGIEQSPYPSRAKYLSQNYDYTFSVALTNVQYGKKADCDRNEKAYLNFFDNYTFDNCMWERRFFMRSRVKTSRCMPAALALTKPTQVVLEDYCTLDQVASSYKAKPLMQWISELHMSAENPCKPRCNDWKYDVVLAKDVSTRTGVIQLRVGYTQSYYRVVSEVLALHWQDYLSLLGGLLGLWLGSSLITLIHLSIYGTYKLTMYLSEHYCAAKRAT